MTSTPAGIISPNPNTKDWVALIDATAAVSAILYSNVNSVTLPETNLPPSLTMVNTYNKSLGIFGRPTTIYGTPALFYELTEQEAAQFSFPPISPILGTIGLFIPAVGVEISDYDDYVSILPISSAFARGSAANCALNQLYGGSPFQPLINNGINPGVFADAINAPLYLANLDPKTEGQEKEFTVVVIDKTVGIIASNN